ncbi:ATP-binding cassette sub-family B member 6-like [Clytia hemisphaerica]|uniref:ATP-binding cassette sub-family B member 6 n=1 Tax=Clytia hemisphaerica TaxID=252671 RepID=A0A7M5XJL0_9CNID|eukprot:TCONS_00027075-protein
MAVIEFCFNSTLTPIWDHGISMCFYKTVQPIVVFILSLLVFCYHQYIRYKCKQSRKKTVKDPQKRGLIQGAEDIEAIPVVDMGENDQDAPNKKSFKAFAFPKLPTPFLYVVQLLLHGSIAVLPVIHIISTLIIEKDHVDGSHILAAILNFLAWVVGFKALKKERKHYFVIKAKRHSVLMLLFWTVALLFECLIFFSLNKDGSFLKHYQEDIKLLNLIIFSIKFALHTLTFLLGLHGPGLHKSKYDKVNDDSKSKDKKDQSWVTDFWEKCQKLWPFVWPKDNWLRLRVLLCVGLLIAGRVINVFVPLYNKKIVNYLTNKSNKEDPWKMILMYTLFMFLQGGGIGSMGLLNNLRSFIWIKVQQYTSRSVQTELFEHLHDLSLRWHLGRKTGEVIRMVDRGSTSIESLLSYILFQIAPTIVDIIVALVFFGAVFNGWFALIVFITMFLYIATTIGITEWRTKYRRDMNEKDNVTKAVAVDSLLNFETVKYYNNEAFEVDRYTDKITDYQATQWWVQMSLNFLNTGQNVVITVGLLVGMLYCGKLCVEDVLDVGDFVLYITYVRQLYMPLNFFGTYYRLIQSAFIDMENMFDLMDQEIEIVDKNNASDLKVNHGLVEFKNVSFHYDERKPVLQGVSFTVLPGTTTALVGPSGSGKSTIIRLLFRFYEVQAGSIVLDGKDIRDVTQRSLRSKIGVVPQDTVLFNDSIKYNIAYGRVGSSDVQIKEAAASSDIHTKIITFPDAYETLVGERGLKLSGGEKQRVAIARTLLKAPDIVLLDEATSALDTQTERNIQASLNRVCANKTTVVVAHRLSTIIGADQILVLKDGLIVERGRHHELLEQEGLYYKMWNQQLQDENHPESPESDKKND